MSNQTICELLLIFILLIEEVKRVMEVGIKQKETIVKIKIGGKEESKSGKGIFKRSQTWAPKEHENLLRDIFELTNLNEDSFLSGRMKYELYTGTTIGKYDDQHSPEIIINGLGIIVNHAVFEYNEKNKVLIVLPKGKVMLNGEIISEGTELKHNDRLLFGNHNYFMVAHTKQKSDSKLDWKMAMREANKEQIMALKSKPGYEEIDNRLNELNKTINADKQSGEKGIKMKIREMEIEKIEIEVKHQEKLKVMMQQIEYTTGKEFQEKLTSLQEELAKDKNEKMESIGQRMTCLEKLIENNPTEEKHTELIKERQKLKQEKDDLDERMDQIIPRINEVNEICLNMNRAHYLFVPSIRTGTNYEGEKISKIIVKIYPDQSQNFFNFLSQEEFIDKYYLIKEKYENYNYDVSKYGINKAEDNFDDDILTFGIGIGDDDHLLRRKTLKFLPPTTITETQDPEHTKAFTKLEEENDEYKHQINDLNLEVTKLKKELETKHKRSGSCACFIFQQI